MAMAATCPSANSCAGLICAASSSGATASTQTPGLSWDKDKLQGHPFYYYAWGGAVVEAVVDTLTGETRILQADLLHDVGASLNPAIDIGQIEGGFVQGLGWLTSEELVWDTQGRLRTHAPQHLLQDPHRQ